MIRIPAAMMATVLALGTAGSGAPPRLPGPRVRLRDDVGAARARFSLPVPQGAVSAAGLAAPHHDYPASDLPVPAGTPVFAAHRGTVATHEGSRCGLGVTIRSPEGYRSVSCHLALVAVETGTRVHAGDVIGLSGDSGNAAGVPHLHFHLRDASGSYLCPQPLFRSWSRGDERSPADRPTSAGCSFARKAG